MKRQQDVSKTTFIGIKQYSLEQWWLIIRLWSSIWRKIRIKDSTCKYFTQMESILSQRFIIQVMYSTSKPRKSTCNTSSVSLSPKVSTTTCKLMNMQQQQLNLKKQTNQRHQSKCKLNSLISIKTLKRSRGKRGGRKLKKGKSKGS